MRTTPPTFASSLLLAAGLFAAGAAVLARPSRAAEPAPVAAAEEPAAVQIATGPVTDAEFDQLHQRLTGMARERVWSIPWQLSVRDARELAAKENKPIFLWISNNGGTHPLGPC